ncbi:FHA domain containing protein, putative [Trypanosoma equiperdum]|uniref:E3 ubiquitin-protein ligase CHFR n=2 Tax=Trypanozoon TaxID=39700 RepID=Q382W2_TRYB2|nr:hypothetical protein, conserved [Trypanosoma brucei brucei TREU927]EAN80169.1 hypothetical protein, conserved [Trypanosoma brucei brucei TREU927]SCU65397.1 FHA domain containing protein, putative [Trypanosoma equiperdum]
MSGCDGTEGRFGRISSWEPSTPPDVVTDSVEDAFEEVAPSVNGPLIARLIPIRDGSTASLRVPMPILEIYRDSGTITMGRSRELPVECRVDVARVSTQHCELRVNAVTRQVTVRDISLNGTFVNGKRLEKGVDVELQSGDQISFVKSLPTGTTATSTPAQTSSSESANVSSGGGNGAEYVFQRVSSTQSVSQMVEELTCSVCKHLYHRPCSALPCMHVFCASCLSKWLACGNVTCMECRAELSEVRPTHKLQNCVEQLLKLNPGLCRSAEELAECGFNDDIPPEGRKLLKRTRRVRDDDGDDYSDTGSDLDDDDDDFGSEFNTSSGGDGVNATHVPQLYQGQTHGHAPATGSCKHCEAPSAVDGFRCPARGMHQSCARCRRLFPMRPLCTRPQRCHLCSTPYCNLYYKDEGGCPVGADGGLTIVSQYRAPQALPPNLFGGNKVEQNIVSSYLMVKHVVVEDVWGECLQKLSGREWVPDITCVNGPVTADSALCEGCMDILFAALLFHYRRCIPRAELPYSVTDRPNCWYGLNCRTQFHNMQHANKYNHACYQEKRKE